MTEDQSDDPEADERAEESDEEGTNSPVVETVKESDGETVNPAEGNDDPTEGDGGASDGE